MNMALVDWGIVLVVLGVMVLGVLLSRAHMKSVADFLSAGRTAGRYAISIAAGIAGLGAITVVANLEAGFEAGFAFSWWGLSMSLVVMVLTAVDMVGWKSHSITSPAKMKLRKWIRSSRGSTSRWSNALASSWRGGMEPIGWVTGRGQTIRTS